jgi:hypothetical protein
VRRNGHRLKKILLFHPEFVLHPLAVELIVPFLRAALMDFQPEPGNRINDQCQLSGCKNTEIPMLENMHRELFKWIRVQRRDANCNLVQLAPCPFTHHL